MSKLHQVLAAAWLCRVDAPAYPLEGYLTGSQSELMCNALLGHAPY